MPVQLDRVVMRALGRAVRRDRALVRRLIDDPVRRSHPRDADWLDLIAAALLSPDWWRGWRRYHGGDAPAPPPQRGN